MTRTRIIGIAAAAALGLTANAAFAQGGYGSLSAFDWEIERTTEEGDFPKLSSKGVRAIGGYMADANIGVEFHVASGGEDDFEFPVDETTTEDADAELNKLLSVFARASAPVNPWMNVYGLAGYSYALVEILGETTATSQSESGFSFGAGVELSLVPERLYLTLDHVEYVSQHDVDINATSLGFRLAFQ